MPPIVLPSLRYGERSEPALKRKRLSQQRKKRKPLGAPTRRSPSIVSRSGSVSSLSFAVRDAFSYAGVHFHSPTLSSALSNPEMIVGTSQETQESWKKTPPYSRSTEVNGATDRAREKARFAAALPGNDAEPPSKTGYESIRTCLIGMLRFMDTRALRPRVSCP